jgi:hypothetical protein
MTPTQQIFVPATPRRRRKRRCVASPAALHVLVTSVVGLADGSARITFNLPVLLTAGGPGETIFFVVEDREGYAEDLTQNTAVSITAVVPGLPIASGATWRIDPVLPCFMLPPTAGLPVPQSGVVE